MDLYTLAKKPALPNEIFEQISGLKEVKGYKCSECDYKARTKISVEKHIHAGSFTVNPCSLLKTGCKNYTFASYDNISENSVQESADHEGLKEMYALMRSTDGEPDNCVGETFFFKKYPWLDFFREETEFISRMQSKEPCGLLNINLRNWRVAVPCLSGQYSIC